MDDPTDPAAPPWTASRSMKEKNAVQRAVTALLDELAPERVLKRVEQLRGAIEQFRTPTGCVLQAPNAALSVSWFAPAGSETAHGELHVVVWRGTVSRRGVPRKPDGAQEVAELVLVPVARGTDDCLWRATTGKEYDTTALAAHCVALLEAQIGAPPSTDSAK
jgi:hypothetical protein